jgi:CHRD domain-containing protein
MTETSLLLANTAATSCEHDRVTLARPDANPAYEKGDLMRKRTGLTLALTLAGALALTVLASYGTAGLGKKSDSKAKRMSGYLEVPSISTTGRGKIEARINNSTSIEYKLTYSGLSGNPSVAHIHFAQPGVSGGIAAFLCGGGGKPACPATGSVSGTIVAADVMAVAGQGIAATEIGELIAAMRAGFTYANVHTALYPSGEIRGQIAARGNGNGEGNGDGKGDGDND